MSSSSVRKVSSFVNMVVSFSPSLLDGPVQTFEDLRVAFNFSGSFSDSDCCVT